MLFREKTLQMSQSDGTKIRDANLVRWGARKKAASDPAL